MSLIDALAELPGRQIRGTMLWMDDDDSFFDLSEVINDAENEARLLVRNAPKRRYSRKEKERLIRKIIDLSVSRIQLTGSRIIDWSPLPSNQDRRVASQLKYRGALEWFVRTHFANIRCFLVENGGLREFIIPDLETLGRLTSIIRDLLGRKE